MGLITTAYLSEEKPTQLTNARNPWENQTDKKIKEWNSYADLHCWFHNLFIEKGGVYTNASVPFDYPDCVELSWENLERLRHIIADFRLPVYTSHEVPKREGLPLTKVWESLTLEARLKMNATLEKHVQFLQETLKFTEDAQSHTEHGKYIYVTSSW